VWVAGHNYMEKWSMRDFRCSWRYGKEEIIFAFRLHNLFCPSLPDTPTFPPGSAGRQRKIIKSSQLDSSRPRKLSLMFCRVPSLVQGFGARSLSYKHLQHQRIHMTSRSSRSSSCLKDQSWLDAAVTPLPSCTRPHRSISTLPQLHHIA